MNADKYIEIICENLEEAVLKMSLEEEFILQQNNDPKHTAKKTNEFFEDSNIKLLEVASTKSRLESNRKFMECIGKVSLEKRKNKIVLKICN